MHTGEIHILLVQANPRDRQAFGAAMDRGGIECVIRESGHAGEAFILLRDQRDRFDLVVADLNLPETSGLELFRQVKELDGLPPFILMSGTDSFGAIAEALSEGVYDYLLKDTSDAYQALLPLVVKEVMERHENSRFRHRAEETRRDVQQALEEEVRKRTAQLLRTNRRLRQEIDERRRLESSLKQNEEQFMLFMEHFPGMVYLKDEQGRFLYLNRYIEDVYGVKVDTCIGKTDRDLWPAEISEAIMEDDRKVLASGKDLLKIEDISFNDLRISLFTQKFPIPQDNSPSMVGGVSIDITDLRRSEQENRLLVSAVEHTAESVFILDSKGRILYLNQAGERSLETPRSDLTGKPYETLIPADTGGSARFSLEGIRGKPWRGTIHRERKDGTVRDLDVVISPLDDESGEIAHYAVIELDVTEEKALQNALERKRRMEALGILASGIAHDFINILQPILINAELVSDMLPPDAPEREFINQIIEASRIGREITSQIKMFGSRRKQVFKPIVLETIVREALTMIKRSLPPNVTLSRRISARELRVQTDAAQVYQLLVNLCTNAVQAMGTNPGTLSVSLAKAEIRRSMKAVVSDLAPGTYVKLSVKDTGCGMTPEVMDQIFDPLFTTKKSSSGAGLGLGVAHSVVKNAGGSIIVRSTPGKGSAFEVYFPVFQGDPERKAPGSASRAGRRKGRILLVDDNTQELRIVHQMLVRLGFLVSSTHEAERALDLFRKAPEMYDLLVTDQLMPVMKGNEMASEMRKIRKDLPVIICSGSEEALQEIRTGNDTFALLLSKPFSPRALDEAIRRSLDCEGFTFS